ncbi:MAG: FMN-binding negative transcriptional regulator [Spirochaetales bacterium]|jgi:transcriptional regulator|nr:FMN-binding negative transcriptional regulator [Spirochaetales bacterium]
MYTPPKFNVEDPTTIRSFVEANAFGLMLSIDGDDIHDTHTPFIYSEEGHHLIGHVAKANPQWKSWKDGTRAKVIFTGPHSYISPKYYVTSFFLVPFLILKGQIY